MADGGLARVRFAPSPTGFLHIGGARTALFNWLFAHRLGGRFLLRIEDTDRERSRREFEDEILSSLKWLGLAWDEPFMRQSERLDFYRERAEGLMEKGLAYPDGEAVTFNIPREVVEFDDLVRGRVSFDASAFGDLVILKSDGTPTYHFSCVLDDHAMGITHVVRGEDHLSNTPRHILLARALGIEPPRYAHLPLILAADGSPLSKRHGAVSVLEFKREGFLAEGLVNYMVLLGWGTSDNQEIFTLEELAGRFSLDHVNKTGARFDLEKLRWVNGRHLKRLAPEAFQARLIAYLKEQGVPFDEARVRRLAPIFGERMDTLKDFLSVADFALASEVTFQSEAVAKHFTGPVRERLERSLEDLERLPSFEDPARIEQVVRDRASALGLKAGDLIHPIRVAITGRTVSPGLFQLMAAMGKDCVVSRLKRVVANWETVLTGGLHG